MVGGILVVTFQQTWKGISRWQGAREKAAEDAKDVDAKDHVLLHEMADVMMDKPATLFSQGSKGIVTRFGIVETTLGNVQSDVSAIRQMLEERQ